VSKDATSVNTVVYCTSEYRTLLIFTGLAGEYTVNGERCLRGGCRLNPDVKVCKGAGFDKKEHGHLDKK